MTDVIFRLCQDNSEHDHADLSVMNWITQRLEWQLHSSGQTSSVLSVDLAETPALHCSQKIHLKRETSLFDIQSSASIFSADVLVHFSSPSIMAFQMFVAFCCVLNCLSSVWSDGSILCFSGFVLLLTKSVSCSGSLATTPLDTFWRWSRIKAVTLWQEPSYD